MSNTSIPADPARPRSAPLVFGRLLILVALLAIVSRAGDKPLVPVANFDLTRYVGVWHEIARLPAWFEKNLDSVTATYSLRSDGKVRVVNEGSRGGKHSRSVGRAKFAGRSDVGALRVSFFGPFFGDYKIIDLDSAHYAWALVASDRKFLWILSRTPTLDPAVVHKLAGHAAELGFDTGKLYFTKQ
jgi:apolipoprotein D and lipocalin family protein